MDGDFVSGEWGGFTIVSQTTIVQDFSTPSTVWDVEQFGPIVLERQFACENKLSYKLVYLALHRNCIYT